MPQVSSLIKRSFVGVASICTFLVAACASPPTNNVTNLNELCSRQDLSKSNQRELLAGGYYAITNKDLNCAERLTTKARDLDINDPYAALNLGAIYQRTNRLELAKTQYEKTIALDPSTNSSIEASAESTTDSAKNKRPSEIARRNLLLLQK